MTGRGRCAVCAGFAQGINLVLASLSKRGIRRVAIEDPGDQDYVVICERLGLQAVPVRIDERGIDVGALVAASVRTVILTPTHQFPTGIALAAERRQEVVAWARAADATIVEDDYDAGSASRLLRGSGWDGWYARRRCWTRSLRTSG